MFKNLFKKTDRNLMKLSVALRGLIGTLAGAAYVQENVRVAFWFLVAGAILDFVIQLLPSDTVIKPGAKVLGVLVLLSLFWLSGCRSIRPESSRISVSDTVVTSYKKVDVPLPDFVVKQSINIDSLLKSLAPALSRGGGAKNEPTKPSVIKDDNGKVRLEYWVDEFGKLQINCQSKDQTIQVLVAENMRLRHEVKTDVLQVYRTPVWNYILLLLLGAALVVALIKK